MRRLDPEVRAKMLKRWRIIFLIATVSTMIFFAGLYSVSYRLSNSYQPFGFLDYILFAGLGLSAAVTYLAYLCEEYWEKRQ